MLIFCLFFLLFFCLFIVSLNFGFLRNLYFLKIFSFFFVSLIFVCSLFLWVFFDKLIFFQVISLFRLNSFFNIYYSLGIDGISIFFVILTTFLIPLCILSSWYLFNFSFKEFLLVLLLSEFFLINFFLVTDLFFFYVFFEGILLPLFVIIGTFGSRQRRIHASFQLFFFTLLGSFFMLFSIIYIYVLKGTTDFNMILVSTFPLKLQLLFWIFFFISLSVKVPLFPFHIWLPEAHVEAPTVGSVILAGVLLKMGTYGMLRFIMPLFPFANWYYGPVVQVLTFMAIVYISIVTLCQVDLKKLIAYSSVAHMGYATMALFITSYEGVSSSVFLMLNHGIVSSLLFFMIGVLYDRYKTRLLFYYQSLNKYMPFFSLICFIGMLANIGFPGTSSFIAEFLIMVSFVSYNKIIVFVNGLGLIFSAIYSFWIYNRIFFGLSNNILNYFSDISLREFFYLFPLIFFIFYFGFFSSTIFLTMEFSLRFLIQESFFGFIF
jgi:NADH-quinone oxidoreductase subunit M